MNVKRNLCISRTDGGRWAIRREGDSRILHRLMRREDAKELGWDVAVQEGVRLITDPGDPATPSPRPMMFKFVDHAAA